MNQFLYPYIICKDTMKQVSYYEDVFNATILLKTMGKDVPNCPKERLESVNHLELEINGFVFYFADGKDVFSEHIHYQLDYEDLELMKQHYSNLHKQSTIIRELGISFWGANYGVLKDPFGIVWHFHYLNQDK